MSIGSVSFWQQDQSYWNQSQSFYQQDQSYWSNLQAQSQASSAESSLISAMFSGQATEQTGLSSIANKTALNRVNQQISTLEQQLGGSSSSGSSSSSSGTTAASSSPYATATGTVPVTWNTSLLTLGIPQNGTVTVSDGTNTTTYTSTGTDTVGDLISAINSNTPGNAYVTASLNNAGKIVIAAKNTTDSITIGGTFASDVGFGAGNTTFKPNPKPASSSASSAASSTPSSSTASSSTSKDTAIVSAASLNASSAASVLSAAGVTGTLVNMLA